MPAFVHRVLVRCEHPGAKSSWLRPFLLRRRPYPALLPQLRRARLSVVRRCPMARAGTGAVQVPVLCRDNVDTM